MTSFRVNVGHRFARPHESEYAMIRRCLTANPGIPLSIIESALTSPVPPRRSLGERVRRLQKLVPGPDAAREFRLPTSYQRQCPRCAAGLYHSDVYAFPWLSRCPIHHCAFTQHCPSCKQPWPDIKALARRDCPTCGRLPIAHLRKVVPVEECIVIGEILAFLADDAPPHYLAASPTYSSADLLDDRIRFLSIHSPLYAAFQAQHRTDYSSARLDALHIERPDIQYRSAQLRPIDAATLSPSSEGSRHRPRHHWSWRSSISKHNDFVVMRRLVDWIARHSRGHTLHLANYRRLHMPHFLSAPDPCPYCLTLSLWYFHIAAARYRPHYERYVDDYPFLNTGSPLRFFNPTPPYIVLSGIGTFSTDLRFERWFYRRILEILFVALFQSVLDWLDRMARYRASGSLASFQSPSSDAEIPAAAYATTIDGDRFKFFYEHAHPIDTLRSPRIKRPASRCRSHLHHHHAPDSEVLFPFDHPFDPRTFSYDAFLSLERSFHAFLSDLLTNEDDWSAIRFHVTQSPETDFR